MEPHRSPSLNLVVDQVVAWHNRHPLAVRIVADNVHGIGLVALPFAASGARRRGVPLFSEDFIAPLSPRRVGRWVGRHGASERPGEVDWPQRDVPADPARVAAAARRHEPDTPGAAEASAVTLYAVTAAIDVDGQRTRVLLGPGPSAKVLGPRHWSVRRLGTAAASTLLPLAALTGAFLWLGQKGSDQVLLARLQPEGQSASEPASQAALHAASQVASHAATHFPPVEASAPASAGHALAEAPARRAEPPPPEPQAMAQPVTLAPAASSGRLGLIVPLLSEEMKSVVRRQGQAMRASDPSPRAPDKAYALVMRATPQRTESEALLAQLHAAAANLPTPAGTHTELLQVRHAWQAVWWPFARRDDAEAARRALAARGLKADVTEF